MISPEPEVALDMAKRGSLVLVPSVVLITLIWDWQVGVSVAYGMAVIMANLVLAAYFLSWAARISLALVPSVALGGYGVRLALVFLAVWLIIDSAWVRMVPLGITLIATHLGLLVWELRHVSASYAHPGLKPKSSGRLSVPAAGYRPVNKFKSIKF